MGFSFESDWLRKWCKFSGPIIKWKKANLQQSKITSDTLLKIFLKWSEEIDRILRRGKVHFIYLSCPFLFSFCNFKVRVSHHSNQHVHNQQGSEDHKQEKHDLQEKRNQLSKQPVYEFRTIATENISRECHKTITNRYQPIRTMVITTRSQGTQNKFMWQPSRKGQVNKLAANGLSFASQVWREFFKSSPMQQN